MSFLNCRRCPACLLALAVAFAGIAASTLVFYGARQAAHSTDAARFTQATDRAARVLQGRLTEQGHAVRALQSVLSVDGPLDRDRWERAVEQLDLAGEFPALKGLSFVARVAPEDLANFTASAQRDHGRPLFVHPPADRPSDLGDYYIIAQHAPRATNAAALGLNLSRMDRRADVLAVARDTGELQMTRMAYMQPTGPDADPRPGVVLFAPVYAGGATPATVDERRERLVGFAGAPMFIDRIVSSMADVAVDGIRIDIADASDAGGQVVGSINVAAVAEGEDASPSHTRTLTLEHGGRTWRMTARAGDAFATGSATSWVLMLLCLLATATLAALVRTLATTRQRAEQIAEAKLREAEAAEARFAEAFESTGTPMLILDGEGRVVHANDASVHLLGIPRLALACSPFAERAHDDSRDELQQAIARVAGGEARQASFEGSLVRDGAPTWVQATFSRVNSDGGDVEIVAHLFDLTQRRLVESDLRHAATHDGLTGLRTRSVLRTSLERRWNDSDAAEAARRDPEGGHHFALLFVDLDRFKPVNDTFGHEAGDAVLRAAAERMRSALRSDVADGRDADIAARLGGDEFALLLGGLRSAADAKAVGLRLQRRLAEPYHVGRQQIEISASIGVATSADGYADERELLEAADLAMYEAKRRGRGQHVVLARDGVNPPATADCTLKIAA